MRWLKHGFFFLVLVGGLFWLLTLPGEPIHPKQLAELTPDPDNGETVFHMGGCASCHGSAESENAQTSEEAPIDLGGGKRFETPFGVFVAPNISTDPILGIGKWTVSEFATAMLEGISPEGKHYYPAFPYASYSRMSLQDVVDLKSFMDRLPPSKRQNESHRLNFPFTIRRGIGLWKMMEVNEQPVVLLSNASPEQKRGQYLVEGPGHCGECHTPRNRFGGLIQSQWLAGARNLEGDGSIPNITPSASGIGDWTAEDIAEYLSSGFTPDYDVVGGSMAQVVDNTSRIPAEDRAAIAAYLKSIPGRAAATTDSDKN